MQLWVRPATSAYFSFPVYAPFWLHTPRVYIRPMCMSLLSLYMNRRPTMCRSPRCKSPRSACPTPCMSRRMYAPSCVYPHRVLIPGGCVCPLRIYVPPLVYGTVVCMPPLGVWPGCVYSPTCVCLTMFVYCSPPLICLSLWSYVFSVCIHSTQEGFRFLQIRLQIWFHENLETFQSR